MEYLCIEQPRYDEFRVALCTYDMNLHNIYFIKLKRTKHLVQYYYIFAHGVWKSELLVTITAASSLRHCAGESQRGKILGTGYDGSPIRSRRYRNAATSHVGARQPRRFGCCSDIVKAQLFITYCTSVYTIELWTSYTLAALSDTRVQYNDAWRPMFRLPRWCRPPNALPFTDPPILRWQRYVCGITDPYMLGGSPTTRWLLETLAWISHEV